MSKLSRRGFIAVSAGLAVGVRPETREEHIKRIVDGMQITTVQWERETLPKFDITQLPLPIIHSDFSFQVRRLEGIQHKE